MFPIVIAILIVVGIFGCMFFYKAGNMQGAKEQSLVSTTSLKTMTNLFDKSITQANYTTNLLLGVIAQKDAIIVSYTKENIELKQKLEEIDAFDGDDFSEEDGDDDEEYKEPVAVAVGKTKNKFDAHGILFEDRSVAHVALELHDKVVAVDTVLESVKQEMSSSAYALLKTNLQLPGKSNVDTNGNN